MVPLRLANMKIAEGPFRTGNPEFGPAELKTVPVGPWRPLGVVSNGVTTGTPGLAGSVFTLVTVVLPVTPYSVAVSVNWFETQKGLAGECEIPHGFCRKG